MHCIYTQKSQLLPLMRFSRQTIVVRSYQPAHSASYAYICMYYKYIPVYIVLSIFDFTYTRL